MGDKLISVDAALDMAEARWQTTQDHRSKERMFGFSIGFFTASALWGAILWITR